MPFKRSSNNRVLPANSRTVDVAKAMLERVVPVQQRKYANTFEVNGYETLVYNRLRSGTPCSCQSSRKAAATILDESGKLKPGRMNELLTGGMSFKVQPYGTREAARPDTDALRGGKPKRHPEGQIFDGAEDGEHLTDFDLDDGFTNPNTTVTHAADDVTDNSELPEEMDDAVDQYDGESYANDTKCAICFGTGYVGGFTLLNGLRLVMCTQWSGKKLNVAGGTIEINRSPHAFMATQVDFKAILPKGIVGVDTFRVWNNDRMVHPDAILIDSLPYSMDLLRALCDGREHTISIRFTQLTYWTHVELQFNTSDQRALFELPRKTDGSNMNLADGTEEMQLNASPAIPNLSREDLLVECTLGKAMIVESVTDWKTAKRQILGWDVNIRVIQPSELLDLLPRRRPTHQQTTYMIRDNCAGHRRT